MAKKNSNEDPKSEEVDKSVEEASSEDTEESTEDQKSDEEEGSDEDQEPEQVDESEEETEEKDEPEEDSQEPEETSDNSGTEDSGEFDPWEDDTVKREYSAPPKLEGPVTDIEEPTFKPPTPPTPAPTPSEESEDSPKEESGDDSKPEKKGDPKKPSGGKKADPKKTAPKKTNQLPDKAKKEGAKQLAHVTLKAYGKLHTAARWFAKVDETEVFEKALDDKLDMTAEIPTDGKGGTISIPDWTKEVNEEIDDTLVLDDDFIKEVKPALTRVYLKHGWGMSDEEYLLYMFGEDVATKLSMMAGFKKQTNQMFRLLEKIYAKEKEAEAKVDEKLDEEEEEETKEEETSDEVKPEGDAKDEEAIEPEEKEK